MRFAGVEHGEKEVVVRAGAASPPRRRLLDGGAHARELFAELDQHRGLPVAGVAAQQDEVELAGDNPGKQRLSSRVGT